MYKKHNLLLLIGTITLSFLAGFIGNISSGNSVNTWYQTIEKPFFNPPNWIFGPVWALLYILMGIAFYLILQSPPSIKRKQAIALFIAQLILNTSWSYLFFGLQNPGYAFINIIILLTLILLMINLFKHIHIQAAQLLYPYAAWVSFATLLNFSILLLN